MDTAPPTSRTAMRARGPWFAAVLLLFVGSGCAALVYEVVWFQLLQLTVGSSAVSLGILLGVYMGGMCLGSLWLPRRIGPAHHPLRVFACLELGVGVLGLVVPFAVPFLAAAYTSLAGSSGPVSMILRAAVAGIVLLPPTLLMGGTLPAVARWVEATPSGVSRLGLFYAGNLAGAVTGSLLAGFYLLRVHDMPTATGVAVAINVVVAALALLLSRVVVHTPPPPAIPATGRPRLTLVHVTIALSGFTALGAEVVWTRLLSLLFGGTVYTFCLLLAVFLVGLGFGSTAGAALARRVARPRAALGACQLSLCAAIAWAAYATGASLPYWPVDPSIPADLVHVFQLDLLRASWAMLPAALLWGASFPLAVGAAAARGADSGRVVGDVYAANTAGAILGALAAGLGLVGTVGSQATQRILIGVAAVAGLLMILPARGCDRAGAPRPARSAALVVAVTVAAGLFVMTVPPLPGLLVAFGRNAATWVGVNEILYVGEGMTSSVAVTRTPEGVLNYHNAGKIQASSEPRDMRLQRMLGHLTTLVPAKPARVLVIGCGAGVTAGAVSIDPRMEQMTIVEIEPLVPRVASTWFHAHNFDVLRNPKVRVHLDDARHFLLTAREKYDAITSDPLDPWVRGAATLYTREFFRVVRQRLNPGGVCTVFMQLYESNEAAVKSEVATFLEVFPDGAVFANTVDDEGYDLVLYGPLAPGRIDVDRVEALLRDPANAAVAASLEEVDIGSAVDLFATYAGNADDLGPWLAGAEINTDRNLRLQFLAGRSLNLYESATIYRHMTVRARWPEHLFAGSPETLTQLRMRIDASLVRSRKTSR